MSRSADGSPNSYFLSFGLGDVAAGLVHDRFSAAVSYADQAFNLLQNATKAYAEIVGDPVSEDLNVDLSLPMRPAIGERPDPNSPPPPTPDFNMPPLPDVQALVAELGLVDISVDEIMLPVLEAISPIINFPPVPDDTLPDFDIEPDPPRELVPPSAPELEFPPPPVLSDIMVPPAPSINEIPFDAELPNIELVEPEAQFVFHEIPYDSELAAALKAKLVDWVTNGGTGLGADVEAAIWERAKARQQTENERMYREAELYFAARGHEQVPGALEGRLLEVSREIARSRDQINYEIMIEMARLAQNNSQFAVSQAVAYEQVLMDYANKVSQRAFDAAKAVVDAAVLIFRAKVEHLQAKMAAYEVQARVYEVRVRAELTKVEIFRAQVEAAKLQAEVQKLAVDIYTARIGALETLVRLYMAQLEGAKLEAELERLKLDRFRALIEAKVAQVNGVTAKFNLYQAQLAGEEIKVKVYSEQVDAYKAQVDAAKVTADIEMIEVQAKVEKNKNLIEVLRAGVEQFKAQVEGEAAEEEIAAKLYGHRVDGYRAEVDELKAWIDGEVDTFKAIVTHNVAEAELRLKAAEAALRAALGDKEMAAEAAKGLSNIGAQLVASALTSVSASANVGYTEGRSASASANTTSTGNDSIEYRTVVNVSE